MDSAIKETLGKVVRRFKFVIEIGSDHSCRLQPNWGIVIDVELRTTSHIHVSNTLWVGLGRSLISSLITSTGSRTYLSDI